MDSPDVVLEAVDFLRLVSDADSRNRAEALEDLRFSLGDQWPVEIQNSRQLEARPCLTINETDTYIRQVCNQQRQQRPRGKAHAVNNSADEKIAEIITGIGRHIENISDADHAYDVAFEHSVRMGWGYFRIVTDYVREDSFDQEIYIQSVLNPFTVYYDPNATMPDGSDAEKCLITDLVPRETFRRLYPDADESQFNERATGDSTTDWITKEDIRIAEYFRVEKSKQKLIMLSDGITAWQDELPPNEMLAAANVKVIGEREAWRRKVNWYKVTAFNILEQKEWAGRYIPVIPVYGSQVIIDGRLMRYGMVRNAKDPQRMLNFWETSITESIALAPKAKWLIAEGQDEGYENDFAQANIKAAAVLRYKRTDVNGQPADPPQRIAPEMPPAGAIQAAMGSYQNLQRVLGVFDPAIQSNGNKSGKALNAEQQQSDMSTFHYYDNLTRSIKYGWRQILDLIPKVYDAKRVMRIIGEDGKGSLVTINDKQATGEVLNDVTVGQYNVVMDVGPGYNSKRQETLATFQGLMQGPMGEMVAKVGADLAVRMIDAPGMEILADRLAAANPLAQIDEKSDIPPQAQMMIKNLQAELQKNQQQVQQLTALVKSRADIEVMREKAETHREEMRQKGDAEERRITQAQKQHDTETYALTAQNVAEINGLVRLLTSKTEHAHRLREMIQEFEHTTRLQDAQLTMKSDQNETVS